MTKNNTLRYSHIFKLWIPLALTWLMIAIEGPFLSAVISRLANPTINLAAYGVAYSIAVIIESPIIMLMSAAIKLVKANDSYLKLRRFTIILNFSISIIMTILLISGTMAYITTNWIDLPEDVSRLTVNSLYILLPWPCAIGFRRFYQGVLINAGKTRRIAYGTIVRIVTMGCTSVILGVYSDLPGVYTGALALSGAVILEAIATRIMSQDVIFSILKQKEQPKSQLTYSQIISFYYPLALTSTISLAVHPTISFFLGHGQMPLESLAVYAVLNPFIFLFRGTFGLSYQEISISMMEQFPNHYSIIRNYAIILGATATTILALIAFTPLSHVCFGRLFNLPENLQEIIYIPLILMGLIPALSVVLSQQRALLISAKTTSPITVATLCEVAVTVIVLYAATAHLQFVGVIAAALALLLGRICANTYLLGPCKKAIKTIAQTS